MNELMNELPNPYGISDCLKRNYPKFASNVASCWKVHRPSF